jgi:hypothetical protein
MDGWMDGCNKEKKMEMLMKSGGIDDGKGYER